MALLRTAVVIVGAAAFAACAAVSPPGTTPSPGAAAAGGETAPFDAARNAMADVDAALARASAEDRLALLVLGANWCHDSRGFAGKLADPAIAPVIDKSYVVVFVDVGQRDRNLDVARRFGVQDLVGTPTLLIVSGAGALLNRDSVHDWRDADKRSAAEIAAYLERWPGE
jgi:hypothetical protein